jgi:GAG-pre-integrase domain
VDIAAISVSPIHGCRTVVSVDQGPFFLDTGATTHILPDRSDFFDLRPIPPHAVRGIGGSSIQALGIGTIKLVIAHGAHIRLENVLFIPNASVCLISISSLCRTSRFTAHFNTSSCWLTKPNGTKVASGQLGKSRSLYSLTGATPSVNHAFLSQQVPNLESWHRRLGHTNYRSIVEMACDGVAEGMHIDLSTEPGKCDHCILGKQVRTPVPKTREGPRSKRKLGIVCVDLMGPEAVKSASGNLYTMNLIDDCTSFIWTIHLLSKSAADPALRQWELMHEQETGLRVGIFRVDNGELKSSALTSYFESHGTQMQFTAPYTSAHNGRSERVHRTLHDKARTMRIQCGLPPNRWDEFMSTACYLTVRTPSRSQAGTTPFEAYHGHKPNLSHLREIGSRAFVLIQNRHNPKLFGHSLECVLIGYDTNSKSYRCYHCASHRVFSSYHVVFIESHNASPHLLSPGLVLGSDSSSSVDASSDDFIPEPTLELPELTRSPGPAPTPAVAVPSASAAPQISTLRSHH